MTANKTMMYMYSIKFKNIFALIVLSLFFGACSISAPNSQKEPRALYTYYFGGIEDMQVDAAVDMLDRLGYAGIAAGARSEAERTRLSEYYKWSDKKENDFEVVSAMMAHRFDKYGFSDADHRAAIDRMAGKEGSLWLWVRDAKPNGSVTDEKVEAFIRGILEYAVSKGVKVILYPHYNTYFPTTEDALALVEKINHPSLGVAINLCHELMSDKGGLAALKQTFERAKGRISTVIISGAQITLDRTSVTTMNASTIKSLDDSSYDLRPFMRLIKDSGFEGPVGFINFKLPNPEDYLKRTIKRWKELCEEVGLYESLKI